MKIRILDSKLIVKFQDDWNQEQFGSQEGVVVVSESEFKVQSHEGLILLPAKCYQIEFLIESSQLDGMGGAGTFQVAAQDSTVNWSEFEGQIGLDANFCEIRFKDVVGILRAQLSSCQFHCNANFTSLKMDSQESRLQLSLSPQAEGRWEIRGEGNKISLLKAEESLWMVSEQEGDFQHAGGKAKVFLNVFGKSTIEWLKRNAEKKRGRIARELQAQDETLNTLEEKSREIEDKSEHLFSMFDEFADQIDAEYELEQENQEDSSRDEVSVSDEELEAVRRGENPAGIDEENKSSIKADLNPGRTASTNREKMLYDLYKQGKLSFEELEKFLN